MQTLSQQNPQKQNEYGKQTTYISAGILGLCWKRRVFCEPLFVFQSESKLSERTFQMMLFLANQKNEQLPKQRDLDLRWYITVGNRA